MTWYKDKPGENNSFSDVPQIAQDNFDATEDAFGQEHYTLGASLCGTHIPGVMGVVKSASTTIINALSSPGSGAMAWNTTLGWWQRYWASAWAIPGSATKWSRVRAYKSSGNQSFDNGEGGSQTAAVTFDAETYDSLSEFAANTFTPADSGYYLVIASLGFSGGTSSYATSGLTYPDYPVTEVWSMCQSRTVTADISLNYSCSTGSNGYACIDEEPLSEDDYIYKESSSDDRNNTFQHSKFSIPAGSTITNVQVVAYGWAHNAVSHVRGMIRVGSTWYESTSTVLNEHTGIYYVFSWTANPVTSSAWTVDQINEVGANCLSGIGLSTDHHGIFGTTVYYHQLYARVNYTYANNNYTAVDEATYDDNDFLTLAPTTSGYAAASEVMSANSTTVGNSTATNMSATISIRAKCFSATGVNIGGVLRVAGTNYYSEAGSAQSVTPSSAALTTTWTSYTFCWSANPAGTAWASGDFDGTSTSAVSAYGFYIYNTSSAASTANVSQCNITFQWADLNPTINVLLLKGGTVAASATKEVQEPGSETDEQITLVEMVYLTAGQTLSVQAKKTVSDDAILSGSDTTYLAIHRLGSQGL